MNHIQNKINALKNALEQLKSGVVYIHCMYGSCNCGIVAQGLTGLSAGAINDAFTENKMYKESLTTGTKYFYKIVESCSVTGMPVNTIVDTLHQNGFTVQDLKELELLSNPKYGGCRVNPNMGDRATLINYLDRWIADLEQHPYSTDATSELIKNINVGDGVDQPVKELVKN